MYVLGLGAMLLWRWMTFLEGHFFAFFPQGILPDLYSAFLIFALTDGITQVLLARYGPRLSKHYALFMWLGALLMSALWLPLCAPNLFSPMGTFLFLVIFPATGSAMQLVWWDWFLVFMPFSWRILIFGIACTWATLVTFFSPWVGFYTLGGITAVLPLMGALVWKTPKEAVPCENFSPKSSFRFRDFPLALACRVFFFYVVCSIFHYTVLLYRTETMEKTLKITDPLYSLGILALGIFFYFRPAMDLRKTYYWAQSLIGLGFVAFILHGPQNPLLYLGLLQLGFGVFAAYTLGVVLYLAAQKSPLDALAFVATGKALITISALTGIFLTHGVVWLAEQEDISFVKASSLLGMALLLVAHIIFRDNRETFAGYGTVKEEQEEGLSSFSLCKDTLRLELIKRRFTRQEVRIALLLLDRHTNGDISQQLNITSNTVRTHLRNIHKKIGTSQREDLLVEMEKLSRTKA